MKQSEIAKAAIEQGVPKTTVDKDWVLGHLLHACYQSYELRDLLIFKGGTCLRKCWIEDYRFSEDLDFTYWIRRRLSRQPSSEKYCVRLKPAQELFFIWMLSESSNGEIYHKGI